MENNATNAFEASMDEVIAAARAASADAAWNVVPEERITTAMGAVAWNVVPNDRIATAMAAVSW